jgi:iron(III) transport system ATP-binding protein
MPMVEIEGVSHVYPGGLRALAGISLALDRGELVCVVGPSGCGKTTLLRLIAGFEELQIGKIKIGGRLVAEPGLGLPPEQRGIGIVFQDYALFPHLDVRDNVSFGLASLGPAERTKRIEYVLQQVGLWELRGSFPHQLSGGEQQRLALARALAPNPPVMLLDEPFSNLDPRLRDQVRDDTLHVLRGRDAATLMVTHDPIEAMFMADRIVVMRRGQVEQVGPPEQIYFQPATAFVARFFGETDRILTKVKKGIVPTAFGPLQAVGLEEGSAVEVLIRWEGVRLAVTGDKAVAARVIESRLLGPNSVLHLCMDEGRPTHLHGHARVAGRCLPQPGAQVQVTLDPALAFVFSAPHPK